MRKTVITFAVVLFCNVSRAQNVDFTLVSDSIVFDGQPYHAFWSTAVISNMNQDTIVIEAIREINILPNFPVWRSALCADICYPFSTDTIQFSVPPLTDQVFEMHFEFTTHNSDTAKTRVSLHSLTPSESFSHTQNYMAMDSLVISAVNPPGIKKNMISVFPNPAGNQLIIESAELKIKSVGILDLLNRNVICCKPGNKIDVSQLKPGTYFLRVNDTVQKFIKQ